MGKRSRSERAHGGERGRPRRGRRSLRLALGVGAVIVVLVAAASLRGWRGDDRPELVRVGSIAAEFPDNHLHGLGYDGANDRLILATHYGLFALAEDGLYQLGPSRDDFMGFSIHPRDPRVIYTSGHPRAGGNLGVMRSADGGRTWRRIFRGVAGETVDFHSMTISAADPARLYGMFRGRLYLTGDGGKTWRLAAARGLPVQGGPCWGVPCLAADSTDPATLYAGTAERLFRSSDGGETWARLAPDGVAGVGADPRSPRRLLAYSRTRGMLLSEDAGQSWRSATPGMALGGDYVFGFAFPAGETKTVFAATVGGAVYRSRDGGESWERVL